MSKNFPPPCTKRLGPVVSLFILFLLFMPLDKVLAGNFTETIGFVGDSISTGGGAHPSLSFDREVMEKIFRDEIDLKPDARYREELERKWGQAVPELGAPLRLPLSRREFGNPLTWVYERGFHYFSHRYLDAEEYSWGYLLSRQLSSSPDRVYIAARNGERAEDASRQIDRLLDATEGKALNHVFMFFTGNDICSAIGGLGTDPESYAEGVEKAVRYYARNARVPLDGVAHVWLLDPLGILQIVSSPSILNHKVRAYGQEMSCRDLQAGQFKAQKAPPNPNLGTDTSAQLAELFVNVFSVGPLAYCPGLFAVHGAPSELQMKLGGLLTAYRAQLAKLPAKLQDLPTHFKVHHVGATAEIVFQGEDMANDCFHLNLKGQLKIAETLRDEMQKVLGALNQQGGVTP